MHQIKGYVYYLDKIIKRLKIRPERVENLASKLAKINGNRINYAVSIIVRVLLTCMHSTDICYANEDELLLMENCMLSHVMTCYTMDIKQCILPLIYHANYVQSVSQKQYLIIQS